MTDAYEGGLKVASTEKATQKAILELCQRPHITLWRSNSGSPKHNYKGAPKGTSDIIGWIEDEGYAIFTALEVKDANWTSPTEPGPTAKPQSRKRYETYVAQQAFIDKLNAAGGIAGFVRSVEDAFQMLGLE